MGYGKKSNSIIKIDNKDILNYLNGVGTNVIAKGVKGDSTDTTVIQSIIDSSPENSVILFPQGYTFSIDSLNVTGKRLTFVGYGATIQCNSSQGAFYKTDHNKKLTVIGLHFVGIGKAINWITPFSGSMYDEFSFQDCHFENADYGIYVDGVREGKYINCTFEGVTQKGIYRTRSINHDILGCTWKNTVYGVHDDGDGTPYSAGAKVIGGTMLGCQYGILSSRVDYCVVTDVMIDYCDNPLRMIGVDIANVKGSYITTRTLNPAVYVDQYSASTKAREIRIIGNAICSNVDDVTSDGMVLKNITSGEISSNSITFWHRYGIDFSDCTNLLIEKNKVNSDPSSTVITPYSIYESLGGNVTNRVRSNEVSKPISVLSAQLESNEGYKTQNTGESVAPSGVTSITVPHGLVYTPTKNEVVLTPTNLEGALKNPYVSTVDATNIIIAFTSATAANAGVAWQVKKTLR